VLISATFLPTQFLRPGLFHFSSLERTGEYTNQRTMLTVLDAFATFTATCPRQPISMSPILSQVVLFFVLHLTTVFMVHCMKDFPSSPCVQTYSGAHPASCTMGTVGLFPGGKARPGLDANLSTPSSTEVKKE
jgi:hypothetical protein